MWLGSKERVGGPRVECGEGRLKGADQGLWETQEADPLGERQQGKQALRLARSRSLWYKAFGGDPHTAWSGDNVPGHSWNKGYLFLVFLLVLVGGFPFALQRDFC